MTKTNGLLRDAQPLPFYIRAPKRGLDYWTGLSRSKIYQLAKDKRIVSVSLREGRQKKATRLFELRSILNYIERSAATGEDGANETA